MWDNQKGKFFSLYWGQNVMQAKLRGSEDKYSTLLHVDIVPDVFESPWFLLLTSLDDITDEHALEVSYINHGGDHDSLKERKGESYSEQKYINIAKRYHVPKTFHNVDLEIVDFLRSKGYALPWMGISIEEQIKLGWVKLK